MASCLYEDVLLMLFENHMMSTIGYGDLVCCGVPNLQLAE